MMKVVGGEPVEEAHGADDLVAGVVDGGAGCGVVLGLAAEASQDPPGGEGGDNFAVLGPGDARDGVGVESLQGGERFVAGGERAVGDEHLADVVRRSSGGVGVESVVRPGHGPGREGGKDRGTGSLAEPVQRLSGRGGRDDRVMHADERVGEGEPGTRPPQGLPCEMCLVK